MSDQVKKIFVTGGAGFIGSNFILYLLKKHPDISIVNLDILTYAGNLENLQSAEGDPRYRFVKGDICDAEVVNDLVGACDAVVHFAAESHVDRSITNAQEFVQTNVMGTHTLLEAALKNGKKRFHHISTDEVFGSLELESDEKFNDATPYDPHSPYSASKAASDHLVRAYFYTYGLPITISNCSNNYGPYQFPEKMIPLFTTNLMEGKKVPVYGDGKNVRDWIYVEDHCEAIDLILEKGNIGETYLVGGAAERSNMEITRELLRLLGKGEDMIEYVADRPGHDRRYAIDFSKITREFGWKPRHSFERGLEETVRWYREHEAWWRNAKSGAYREYYERQYGKK